MKMYVFVLHQLSVRDQGIQACHAVCELIRKYRGTSMQGQIDNWLDNHKTLIYLNGGRCKELCDIASWACNFSSSFASTYFIEPDLNQMLTAVVVLVPPAKEGLILIPELAFRDRLATFELA